MTRYNQIRKMDVANGEGMRTSIFLQGCPHRCEGCFSEDTWDEKEGKKLTPELIDELIEATNHPEIDGITILGGEPLAPYNLDVTKQIAKRVKEELKKTVWVYTGYVFEKFNDKQRDAMDYVDVLVDGKFVQNLLTPPGEFKGSANQRVIYMGEDDNG